MGLARDLVELEARIRRDDRLELFAVADPQGLLSIPECASLAGRLHAVDALGAVRLCLQALRIQHSELEPRLLNAELVATLPPETPGLARPTERVVHEMVSQANTEVILLGYELRDEVLVKLLARASGRGADVVVICDRGRGALQMVNRAWPRGVRRPKIFQDRARTKASPYASMHAKCMLVDGCDLLVTSANFTFHGLHGNIELGVRLGGSPAAEARKIFTHLVESRVLEEV